MIRGKYYGWLLPLLMCLLTACDEDDYHYPSVKLEYLTAFSGADGDLQSILTDDGTAFPIVEDASNMNINANSSVRIVSNYGNVVTADGAEGVKLYATLNTVSPLPMSADKFKDGVKKDPADILAIWMGLNYLNVTLEVKAQGGKHQFGFIEDEVTIDPETGHSEVSLTLYHNAGDDMQAYTNRAYLSVPLKQYAVEGIQKVTIHFSLHTYAGKLQTYSFEYLPSLK